jgi:hypothetical protein
MKTAAGVLIIAIVLLVGGAIALGQAQNMRRLVAGQQRLATLHYADDPSATSDAATAALLKRVSMPFVSSGSADNERATLNYWQARYEQLAPLTGNSGSRQTSDPNTLLIAANAAFRATHLEDGKAAVGQLDGVMQAYGDVLRADANNLDASYNYEYVAKLRDTLAKGKAPKREQAAATLSTDLPVGPTLHGRPGGPPPDVAMKDFKTVSPLETDERGEQIEVGRRPVQRKRG